PLTDVFTRHRVLQLFVGFMVRADLIDDTRERGTEPGKMRPSIAVPHVVRVGKDLLDVRIIPLERNLHLDGPTMDHGPLAPFAQGLDMVSLILDVDDIVVERRFILVEDLDELANPSLEAIFDPPPLL